MHSGETLYLMEEHINCIQSSSFPSQVITVAFLSPSPKPWSHPWHLSSLTPHPIHQQAPRTKTWPLATTNPANTLLWATLNLSVKYCSRLLTDLPMVTLTLLLSPYTAARVSMAQNLPLTSHLTPIKSQDLHKHLQALTWSAANHTLTSPVPPCPHILP